MPISLPMTSSDGTALPPLEEIHIMLELLMEDLNLTEDKKHILRSLPDDRKWIMLQQHLGERYRDGGDINSISNEDVDKLKADKPDKDFLVMLVVSLRSRPIRWITNFIETGGLDILLANLKRLENMNWYFYSTLFH